MDIHPPWKLLSKSYFCKTRLSASLNNEVNSKTAKQTAERQLLTTLADKPERRQVHKTESHANYHETMQRAEALSGRQGGNESEAAILIIYFIAGM